MHFHLKKSTKPLQNPTKDTNNHHSTNFNNKISKQNVIRKPIHHYSDIQYQDRLIVRGRLTKSHEAHIKSAAKPSINLH